MHQARGIQENQIGSKKGLKKESKRPADDGRCDEIVSSVQTPRDLGKRDVPPIVMDMECGGAKVEEVLGQGSGKVEVPDRQC
jgi:hypothetical protein